MNLLAPKKSYTTNTHPRSNGQRTNIPSWEQWDKLTVRSPTDMEWGLFFSKPFCSLKTIFQRDMLGRCIISTNWVIWWERMGSNNDKKCITKTEAVLFSDAFTMASWGEEKSKPFLQRTLTRYPINHSVGRLRAIGGQHNNNPLLVYEPPLASRPL